MERSRCLVLDTDLQRTDPPLPHESCYSKFVEDYDQQGSDTTQFNR